MAANTASGGPSLGSVYSAIDQLKDSANTLLTAYENDEPVAALAEQAMAIRIDVSRLENTLDAISAALDSLG